MTWCHLYLPAQPQWSLIRQNNPTISNGKYLVLESVPHHVSPFYHFTPELKNQREIHHRRCRDTISPLTATSTDQNAAQPQDTLWARDTTLVQPSLSRHYDAITIAIALSTYTRRTQQVRACALGLVERHFGKYGKWVAEVEEDKAGRGRVGTPKRWTATSNHKISPGMNCTLQIDDI